jgi:hypothetical protein
MTDQQRTSTSPNTGQGASEGTFAWHPEYAGQTFDTVERGLASEIARDQRQYHLALEGAEQSEHESLSSVVELERRWGNYAFEWAEMDAGELARRIVSFERERERRREMISFGDYRAQGGLVGGDGEAGHRESRALPLRTIAIAAVVVIVIILILALAIG